MHCNAEFRSYWEAVLIGCGYSVAVACCSVTCPTYEHPLVPKVPR